jgi:hypothetical protein
MEYLNFLKNNRKYNRREIKFVARFAFAVRRHRKILLYLLVSVKGLF